MSDSTGLANSIFLEISKQHSNSIVSHESSIVSSNVRNLIHTTLDNISL